MVAEKSAPRDCDSRAGLAHILGRRYVRDRSGLRATIPTSRKWRVGIRNGNDVQITEGLKAGERVVTVGAFELDKEDPTTSCRRRKFRCRLLLKFPKRMKTRIRTNHHDRTIAEETCVCRCASDSKIISCRTGLPRGLGSMADRTPSSTLPPVISPSSGSGEPGGPPSEHPSRYWFARHSKSIIFLVSDAGGCRNLRSALACPSPFSRPQTFRESSSAWTTA